MLGVRITITRFVDSGCPGFVECALADARGRVWSFIEKVPVVSDRDLDEESSYPLPAVLACSILERRQEEGREIVTIDTDRPWGVAAITGETRFEVDAAQIVAMDDG